MLIEDDMVMGSLLTHILHKSNFNVVHMNNSKMALEAIKNKMPDLVICDIVMPYYSGFEITGILRNELHTEIPVVIISCLNDQDIKDRALKLGANAFFTKPIGPKTLIKEIKSQLKAKSLGTLTN